MSEFVNTLPVVEHIPIEQTDECVVPMYNVLLLDDDVHTYDYVIEMLMTIFGHSRDTAYQMARTVDKHGRVVVDTTYKERAQFKRDQIQSFGADWRIPQCVGSMSAEIEPAERPRIP